MSGKLLLWEMLSVFIHFFVVAFVVAGGDIVHPFLVVKIPTDGLFDAFLKLEGGFPVEFTLEFAAVDGIAHVVAEAVFDKGYQFVAVSFGIAKEPVNSLYDYLDDVNVFPFVESADIICFGYFAVMEYGVDGTGVVFDI